MTKLGKVLAEAKLPPRTRAEPLWQGPSGKGSQGGVTQSMLAKFLTCPERFRVSVMEGLGPKDAFEPRRDFGTLWHACEEGLATGGKGNGEVLWRDGLQRCAVAMANRYPMQQEQVQHWHDIAKALFPHYVKHWAEHPDVKNRTPLLQEQVFDVSYCLPSGRTVRLRGKWDSVDLIGKGKEAGVWLQENKTKSSIDVEKIDRQLRYDLQTQVYLIALTEERKNPETEWGAGVPVAGVRYNCIRRPAHKSTESMLKKLEDDRKAGRLGEWFARWQVPVTADDLERFRRETLDPVLENLVDDFEWWADQMSKGSKANVFNGKLRAMDFPHHVHRHFRMPYFYSPLGDGGFGEVDNYLDTGSQVGLAKVENLFPELR